MWVIPRKRIQNNQGTARSILPNLATNYLMYRKCESYFFLNICSQIQGPGILFSRLYNLQKFLNLRCELTMKKFQFQLKGSNSEVLLKTIVLFNPKKIQRYRQADFGRTGSMSATKIFKDFQNSAVTKLKNLASEITTKYWKQFSGMILRK